jgi:hypothetical protein
MKNLDRSDREHINKVCAEMLTHLANATVIINKASKEDHHPNWDLEKSARAVERIAVFVATFPFLHAYTDYTNIIRFFVQKLNEFDDPTLIDNN